MKKRNHTARNAMFALSLIVLVVVTPTADGSKWIDKLLFESQNSSFADIWVDKGCGGHYRAGEPITILFKVEAPASRATVTIINYTPGEELQYLVLENPYDITMGHTLIKFAACPVGRHTLEILVTIPASLLQPGSGQKDLELADTCHYYVDSPCEPADTDKDGYYTPEDCNDENPLVHPEAQELCDEKDNDCDGLIDEGCTTCLADRDYDSFPECNDCNDSDHLIYPGAQELCDGKDNNCNGLTDEGCCICYDDNDKDGYSDCWDCVDTDSTVYPNAPELCDGKDNDCDGFTDEGGWCDYAQIWVDLECGLSYNEGDIIDVYYSVQSHAPTAEVTITEYAPQGRIVTLISDKVVTTGDVYNFTKVITCPTGLTRLVITASVTVRGELKTITGECGFYVVNCRTNDKDGDGYDTLSSGGSDCDDSNFYVHPKAQEVCDGRDNDCDGLIDEGSECNFVEIRVGEKCGGEYQDRDEIIIYFTVHSQASTARVTITLYPPKARPRVLASEKLVYTNKEYFIKEVAQCKGLEKVMITAVVVVEGSTITLSDDCSFQVADCLNPDNDGDGYSWVLVGGEDCDDSNPDVNPGAEEVCDRIDNDCDGLIDEEPDKDGDGFISVGCGGTDCDDYTANSYPGAEEIYDKKDNDCDGEIDEGLTMDQIDSDQDGYTMDRDCNDKNATVYPGAPELCDDGQDNDCNGLIDCEDEACELDSVCERSIFDVLFDLSSMIALLKEYKFFAAGIGAGLVAVILVTYVLVRRRKKAPPVTEEISPLEMPEEGEEPKVDETFFEDLEKSEL